MTNNKFGAVNWDEVNLQNGKGNKSRDSFLRLDSGDNQIRILTKPHEYLMHKYKVTPTDPGYGTRVKSSLFHGRDCLVDAGHRVQKKWYLGVIDRKTQSYRILDIGPSIFKDIQELVRDEDWGDPVGYDLNIRVDKQGGAQGYYNVIPKSKKPLSPADLEIKQSIDLENLKKLASPPTILEMEAQVALIKERRNQAMGLTSNGEKKESVVDAVIEEDENFDFPSVEA